MRRLRFHIRFPEGNIREPILYHVGREYNVVTDIRQADIRETRGWADVQVYGDTVEIDRAIAEVRAKGCVVDPIELSVME